MKKVAIVYGTSTGTAKEIAEKIQKQLGTGDIYDAGKVNVDQLKPYEFYILGSSTTGYGDVQPDWEDLLPKIENLDFTGKEVAIFGLGDSSSYSDTFTNGMSEIYNGLKDKAEIVGSVSTDGYSFDDSESVVDGKFIGLAIDEENEPEKTDERISAWINDIKQYV